MPPSYLPQVACLHNQLLVCLSPASPSHTLIVSGSVIIMYTIGVSHAFYGTALISFPPSLQFFWVRLDTKDQRLHSVCLQRWWWWLFQAENLRSADLPCVNSFAQLLCLRTNPKNSVRTFFPPPSFLMQTDRQFQAIYKSTHRSSDLLVYPQFSGPMKASVEANEGTGQFFPMAECTFANWCAEIIQILGIL